MSFLGLEGKTFVVAGVANKKSVAWHVARGLEAEGARVVYIVRSSERREQLTKLLADREVHVCDVEYEEQIESVAKAIATAHPEVHGLVHSIAFANYENGIHPFHETPRPHFLQAVDISCFSLIALANALRPCLHSEASVVTISISTTTMAAESYGYMAPIKAALDSTVVFLAKSFAAFSQIRFNAVKAGPLKTSASAGIPGYLENYLFAESATIRHRAVTTPEVADTALFLLSERSSGINAQGIVIDAGMDRNYFDRAIVERATRPD